MVELISPITHVDRSAAPLLLLHGTSDTLVPMAQSESLPEKYRQAGLNAELLRFEGASHPFWNSERYFSDVMNRSVAFFRRTLVPGR